MYTLCMDPELNRHRTIPLTRLRASIGSVVDEVRDGAPIVVVRRGEPAAVIVSYADFKGSVGLAGRVRKAADLLALVDRARGAAVTGESVIDLVHRSRAERSGQVAAASRRTGARSRRRGKAA